MTPPIVQALALAGSGPKSTAGWRQREIGAVEDRAGPGAQPPPAILDRDAGPIAAHVDQDAVALGLAAQARARGAEGDGFTALPRIREDLAHVVDAAGDHHGLGKQAVRAGVGREADQVDCPRQHALGTDQGAEVRGERVGGAAREPVGGTVALRCVGLGRQCADVRGEEPAHGRLPVGVVVGSPGVRRPRCRPRSPRGDPYGSRAWVRAGARRSIAAPTDRNRKMPA